MLEIIQNFERTASSFDPKVKLLIGLAGAGIGLFLWLGGLGLKKPLTILIGLASGAVAGFILTNHNLKLTVLSAAAAAVVALTVEQTYSRIFRTGFFFARLIPALFCAACGGVLVFAGMVSLLLFKGTRSFDYISTKESFYNTVFAVMVAFGTVIQLLLCPRMKEKLASVKRQKKRESEPDKKPNSWRNR